MAGQDIAARLREVLSGAEDETRTRIENLERERAALAAERKRVTKEERSAKAQAVSEKGSEFVG